MNTLWVLWSLIFFHHALRQENSMYVQKSFAENTTFRSNAPGVVAKLGELSDDSSTFSREKGVYANKEVAPNMVLTSFISKADNTNIQMPVGILDATLQICQFVYQQTLNGQIDILATVLLENLLTQFTGTASDFDCGNMISDGIHTLPQWVSWKCLSDATQPENFNKVWFVDTAFNQQYDDGQIVVVPPIDVLDNFFKPGSDVETMIRALTSTMQMERVQAAKVGHPETIIRTLTFNYVDPINSAHTVSTDWVVLIHGRAMDNVDSQKDALQAAILANSTHTRDDWVKIFPDIFKRTEFILYPLWDQYAIPNRVLDTGIYSNQVRVATAVALMKDFATQYPGAHIDSYTSMMSHPYRSLAVLSIGSNDNRNAQYMLSDIFPDLIAVTSTSSDFNRMSQKTQDWASILANMLVTAEKMTEFTVVPIGMMKVKRDGKLYLTATYDNINYLMVAKSNLAEVV
jgi:hypothetical protein